MQHLGLQPGEEVEFGWIADVALQSPLPPRWGTATDESTGYVYYVNHDCQTTRWENPLLPYFQHLVEVGRAYRARPRGKFFEEAREQIWLQHKRDLEDWHGPFLSPEGQQYFVNSVANLSSWSDPRVDAQYIFELESSVLKSLEEVLPPPEPDTPVWGGEADAESP